MSDDSTGDDQWTATITDLQAAVEQTRSQLAAAQAELRALRQSSADPADLANQKREVNELATALAQVKADLASLSTRPALDLPPSPAPVPSAPTPDPPPAPRSRHAWL